MKNILLLYYQISFEDSSFVSTDNTGPSRRPGRDSCAGVRRHGRRHLLRRRPATRIDARASALLGRGPALRGRPARPPDSVSTPPLEPLRHSRLFSCRVCCTNTLFSYSQYIPQNQQQAETTTLILNLATENDSASLRGMACSWCWSVF